MSPCILPCCREAIKILLYQLNYLLPASLTLFVWKLKRQVMAELNCTTWWHKEAAERCSAYLQGVRQITPHLSTSFGWEKCFKLAPPKCRNPIFLCALKECLDFVLFSCFFPKELVNPGFRWALLAPTGVFIDVWIHILHLDGNSWSSCHTSTPRREMHTAPWNSGTQKVTTLSWEWATDVERRFKEVIYHGKGG